MKRVLVFFNLLDAQGNLSITNIAAIIAVIKMAFTAQFSGMDAVGLIGALANYAHKRSCNHNDPEDNN